MVVALVFVLLVAAAFTATDAAVSALGRHWLEREAEREAERGGPWARGLHRLGQSPRAFRRATLAGNTVLVATISVLWTIWVYERPEPPGRSAGLALTLAGAIGVALLFGSIGPRLVAVRHAETVARLGLRPVAGLFLFFGWISSSVGWVLAPLVRFAARGRHETVPQVTEEEVKRVIAEGLESGAIAAEEREMLHSVIEFTDTVAREVMVPRLDIVALEVGASPAEIVRVALEEGYSRVPVYKGTLDNIVGIVHVKDFLRVWEHRDLIVLYDIMRKPHFIPETKNLSELLREFQTRNVHMAIVVDEFGATEGLVTLEDILEEIVGDIRDEHDSERPLFTRNNEGAWLVEGRMALEDFRRMAGLDIPPSEMDTVSGFVLGLFGHIPEAGERVRYGGHVFEALEVDRGRLTRVRMERVAETSAKHAESGR